LLNNRLIRPWWPGGRVLHLPLASKYPEERTIRKASLLVCESVFIGLFGTRPGGVLSNCPFFTHYKGGNLQWPLHDGGWVKEANWLKREGQALQALHDYWVASKDPPPRSWREFWIPSIGIEDEDTRMDRCKSRRSSLKRRATCGTNEERHAIGFPAATEDQIEARQAKERQYRATWTPGFKALVRKRKREKRASLTKEQRRQAINKKMVAAWHKGEQKQPKSRRQRRESRETPTYERRMLSWITNNASATGDIRKNPRFSRMDIRKNPCFS
jgi:hypothetical protein